MWFQLVQLLGCIVSVHAYVGVFPPTSDCPIPSSWYRSDTVVVPVKTVSDFYLRYEYDTSQHVTLEVQNDIRNVNLLMDQLFSNTTIVSKCGVGYTLKAPDEYTVPILIIYASNVSIVALNISVKFLNDTSGNNPTGFYLPQCTDSSSFLAKSGVGGVCPAVLLIQSSQVEIVGNSIYGSLSLHGAADTIVDGNFVTPMATDNGINAGNSNFLNGTTLWYKRLIVRNNWVNASGTGIYLPSVNATIINNNITNTHWTGVFVHGMLNYVAHNFIGNNPGYPRDGDGNAIYISAWRYIPNNTITLNYMNYSGHCVYNDYWTGGTIADCNICAHSGITYKQNMGWKVQITNLLSYGSHATYAGWCEDVQNIVCTYHKPPPQTHLWMEMAPWIFPMCLNDTLEGIPCSPDQELADQSGNCSGLSLYINVSIASVLPDLIDLTKLPRAPVAWNVSLPCQSYPIADQLNYYNATIYLPSNVSLDSEYLVHVKPGSQLAKDKPCLGNFPFDNLGIQKIGWQDISGLDPILS